MIIIVIIMIIQAASEQGLPLHMGWERQLQFARPGEWKFEVVTITMEIVMIIIKLLLLLIIIIMMIIIINIIIIIIQMINK